MKEHQDRSEAAENLQTVKARLFRTHPVSGYRLGLVEAATGAIAGNIIEVALLQLVAHALAGLRGVLVAAALSPALKVRASERLIFLCAVMPSSRNSAALTAVSTGVRPLTFNGLSFQRGLEWLSAQ